MAPIAGRRFAENRWSQRAAVRRRRRGRGERSSLNGKSSRSCPPEGVLALENSGLWRLVAPRTSNPNDTKNRGGRRNRRQRSIRFRIVSGRRILIVVALLALA